MTSPDLNLLRRKIGLQPYEDYPWFHEITFRHSPSRPRNYDLNLGGRNKSVGLKFLRSLLHLSRLDRAIEQRKKAIQ